MALLASGAGHASDDTCVTFCREHAGFTCLMSRVRVAEPPLWRHSTKARGLAWVYEVIKIYWYLFVLPPLSMNIRITHNELLCLFQWREADIHFLIKPTPLFKIIKTYCISPVNAYAAHALIATHFKRTIVPPQFFTEGIYFMMII